MLWILEIKSFASSCLSNGPSFLLQHPEYIFSLTLREQERLGRTWEEVSYPVSIADCPSAALSPTLTGHLLGTYWGSRCKRECSVAIDGMPENKKEPWQNVEKCGDRGVGVPQGGKEMKGEWDWQLEISEGEDQAEEQPRSSASTWKGENRFKDCLISSGICLCKTHFDFTSFGKSELWVIAIRRSSSLLIYFL